MPQKFLSLSLYGKYKTLAKCFANILTEPCFLRLDIPNRYLGYGLAILAYESENKVYNDRTYIGQRLYIPHTEIDLRPLYRSGFLNTSNLSREIASETDQLQRESFSLPPLSPPSLSSLDSSLLSPSLSPPNPFQRESVCAFVDFDVFWKSYPRKQAKDAAKRAWKKLNPDHTLNTLILTKLEEHKGSEKWREDNGKYIPHAASWLNGKRWEDELTPKYGPPEVRKPVVVEIRQEQPSIGKDEASSILKRLGMTSVGEL
jgi:hypothetical protein